MPVALLISELYVKQVRATWISSSSCLVLTEHAISRARVRVNHSTVPSVCGWNAEVVVG